MHDEELELVEFGEDGFRGVLVLSGEDDDFVELGHVCEEVICARAFGCAPAMLALRRI